MSTRHAVLSSCPMSSSYNPHIESCSSTPASWMYQSPRTPKPSSNVFSRIWVLWSTLFLYLQYLVNHSIQQQPQLQQGVTPIGTQSLYSASTACCPVSVSVQCKQMLFCATDSAASPPVRAIYYPPLHLSVSLQAARR